MLKGGGGVVGNDFKFNRNVPYELQQSGANPNLNRSQQAASRIQTATTVQKVSYTRKPDGRVVQQVLE